MAQKNALGKGLGAIFPDLLNDLDKKIPIFSCGIEELQPNRYQPRKNFHDNNQKQLVDSIKSSGIIQPIIVRKLDKGYEIIAGERRWRAAQAAGLKDVPIVIREATDRKYPKGRVKPPGRSGGLHNFKRKIQPFSGSNIFSCGQGSLDNYQYHPAIKITG